MKGDDLYLTIDIQLQEYVEGLLEEKKGAIVVMNPQNGEILAITSKPDYDPNIFSGIISNVKWDQLSNDPAQPLYHRASQGLYPPGSTYKIVAEIAALEEKVITPDWIVNCPGYYRLGKRIFKCWAIHGKVNIYSAIEQSCNVYFFTLILKLGIDRWSKYVNIFRFGEYSQIDIPEESVGVAPNRTYMDIKYAREGWTEGNLLNMVVGQGDVLVTPIQMAVFTSLLATHGKWVEPHIGYATRREGSSVPQLLNFMSDSIIAISQETWSIIDSSLSRVIFGKRGTGRLAKVKGLSLYGKTGTAQNPHGEDHAWFIGFSRNSKRPLAIVILIENGGSGSTAAAPLAGKIWRFYDRMYKNYYQ
jgi:penicillin-binding protein 2